MEELCRAGGPNGSVTPDEGPGFPNPVPQPRGRTRSVQQSSLPLPSDHGIPTSVAFTSTEPAHIVASFRSGDTVLYDLEAGSALLSLESRGSSGKRGPGVRGWYLSASKAPIPPVALVI